MRGARLMLGTKITTTRATFARTELGEPPTVASHKTLTRIEVSIERRWAEEGIPTTLLDFAKAPKSQGKTLLLVG